FQAALHALERFQGLSNLRFGDAVSNGHGRGSSSVENVVLSGKRKIEVSPVAAFAQDRPVSALTFELQVGGLPGGVVRAIALNWAKGFGHALAHIGVAFVSDDAAAARHQVDQAPEGGLHRVQVLVNVCVIELNGSEDDGIGKVVQELGTLVKKGGVVLVPLDDEVAAVAEGETAAEILRDAAHQERRPLPCRLKDPGQHGGGGGLAVSAGNDDDFAAAQKFVVQNLRQRAEGDAAVEQVFQFHVAAGNGVAHHD